MSFKGRKNAYTCSKCRSVRITVNRDDGTTPFLIACKATPECKGLAESAFYQCDQNLTPTHEWYRMSQSEVWKLEPNARDHHEMGGLFLRAIEPVEG